MGNAEQWKLHPLKGRLFENLVVMEVLKKRYNSGKSDNLFFWRNNTGNGIDLILDDGNLGVPIEIKAGQTISSDYFKGLKYWEKLTQKSEGYIVYAGDTYQKRSNGIEILPYREISKFIIV